MAMAESSRPGEKRSDASSIAVLPILRGDGKVVLRLKHHAQVIADSDPMDLEEIEVLVDSLSDLADKIADKKEQDIEETAKAAKEKAEADHKAATERENVASLAAASATKKADHASGAAKLAKAKAEFAGLAHRLKAVNPDATVDVKAMESQSVDIKALVASGVITADMVPAAFHAEYGLAAEEPAGEVKEDDEDDEEPVEVPPVIIPPPPPAPTPLPKRGGRK